MDLAFAHGLGFTTAHDKRTLRGINIRGTDRRHLKYYLWLASFCCRFEVFSFYLNAFIERVYNIVAAIAKDCVQWPGGHL